jgi:acetyl esterase/lipase
VDRFLFLAVCAFASAAFAQQRPMRPLQVPEGVKALRDIEYVPGGGRAQSLDLYAPEAAKTPLPLIIWIHGGAFRAGDKQQCPVLPSTRHGYAVTSINYRLSQQAKFPAQIEDCKAAVRWLRAHAKEYNLDPKRFGAWGSSAGGHLVAMLGTSGGVKELEGKLGHNDQSSRVQAVCDWFGPTDFTKMNKAGSTINHDVADSPESLLLGGPVQENKDKAAQANPITYVSKDDPPFLIMHGDRDPLVPHNQSVLLHDALKRTGVEVTFHTIKGAGHGFGSPEIMRTVEDFFDQHLKPSRP